MNNTVERFKVPPIIEVVLDVDCDFSPGADLATLEKSARDSFHAQYPKLQIQQLHQFEIIAQADAPPQPTIKPHRIQAFQFLTEDKKQLVQLRQQGYAFNRLAPYTTLDDYLPEIERTWNDYRTVAMPILIRAIRLRYINRILLPMNNGACQFDEFLKGAPQLPGEGRLALKGFITQRAAVDVKTGHEVNIILTAQQPAEDKLPVILDICAVAPEQGDPADWAWLQSRILAIKALCDNVFTESVTETCLNLFR